MAVAQRGFERRSHVIRFGVLLPVLLHTSMALQVHLNALPSTHMGSLGPKSFLQLPARLRGGSAGLAASRASVAPNPEVGPKDGNDVSVWEWRKREAGNIMRFAIPALSIPLADPVMSLVDAICVGQLLAHAHALPKHTHVRSTRAYFSRKHVT